MFTPDQTLEMVRYSYFKSKEGLRLSIQEHLSKVKEKLAPSTLKVLDVLRLRAMKVFGVAYLKIETIMKLTKVSRASVERGVRKLEQVGIIKRITTARKTGLQGANIFVFLPSNDGVGMKGLEDRKKPTASSSEADNGKSNTGVFNTPKNQKENNKDNVKVTRLEKDFTAIPSYIPKEFVKAIKPAFSCGAVIKQFWSRVVMFKRVTGWERNENVIPVALDAWEYTKNEYKRDQKEWGLDRFLKCFYGTMKRIEEKRTKELVSQWS
ncbi:helix-turn-helix domain-containing protein [Brevibacillus laterosporus]|uniref:helix-turn-helix domain-containing protein n=1 Tax=Brevibacillus laterosporus TaxID=1465 RepID=UPI0014446DD2|nr:hypothetical protein [Brevibacillus laterosporus]WNX29766.1 hypothetical protein RWW94_16200 [Brevibacillus laterosporus]